MSPVQANKLKPAADLTLLTAAFKCTQQLQHNNAGNRSQNISTQQLSTFNAGTAATYQHTAVEFQHKADLLRRQLIKLHLMWRPYWQQAPEDLKHQLNAKGVDKPKGTHLHNCALLRRWPYATRNPTHPPCTWALMAPSGTQHLNSRFN